MVLIQLLLPASGAASAGGLVPVAETRRQLAERFNGLTAYLRSPAKGLWTAPDAVRSRASRPEPIKLSTTAPRHLSIRSRLSVTTGCEPGDLSLLRTLEALAIGVQGKRCLWRALQNVRTVSSTVDGMNFVALEAKAVRQREAIEERRGAVVARTFCAAASRAE
jgi:hypothetical protein